MAQTGRNLPPPQSAFVDKLLNLSNDGYQYLLSLLAAAASAIPTSTTDLGLAATGTNQATAPQLTSQWNVISTTPLGAGVLLSSYQAGQSQTVFNQGANALSVYPPPGSQIDALGTNIAYSLAPGLRHTFDFISGTQIFS